MNPREYLVTMFVKRLLPILFLTGALWQSGLTLLTRSNCGPAGMHDHVIIGKVNAYDLSFHTSSERACFQSSVNHTPVARPKLWTSEGVVLSVLNNDQHAPAMMALLVYVALTPSLLLMALIFRSAISGWLPGSYLGGRPLIVPPPTPPPEFLPVH